MASERREAPAADRRPRPPFPKQHQRSPGLESKLEPRPRFEGEGYKPAGKLLGKVALITGGDSGIGRAVAVMYAREGADVAIAYLSEKEDKDARRTADLVEKAGRKCVTIRGDLGEEANCQRAV